MPRTHARTCMTETRIARPPTSHRNRQLPEIFLPWLLPRFFPSWTAQRMSCSCVSSPPRTKSPFSVIAVGAHHIYDDTGFCHNYRHRSVICMTEKNSFGPKCHGCVFFCSEINSPAGVHHITQHARSLWSDTLSWVMLGLERSTRRSPT